MKYLLVVLILVFYMFFFIRAYTLSKSLGKNIKARNALLNFSIFFAALSSVIFLGYLFLPQSGAYLFILFESEVLTISGTVLIISGLAASSFASLNLKRSWRIGVSEDEKTELITGGFYSISRNPYFLSYDVVLIGMILCVFSPVLMLPVLATIVLFHLMILKEEKYLEKQHGESYREYKLRVRRYI